MQQRFIFITIALFSISTSIFCQDYISINNEEKFKVNILEIGSEYVIYEPWVNDGITYRINRSEITDIDFDDSMEILFRDSYPVFANSNKIVKSKNNGNYLVGEVWIGDFWSLESYFNKNHETSQYFFKAKKQNKAAKILGVTSLVLIGGGLILAAATISNHNYDLAIVGAFSAVFLGPALGTAGIITKISSIGNKKKAEVAHGVRYVNQSLDGVIHDVASLNLGISQNGLGLVLQF